MEFLTPVLQSLLLMATLAIGGVVIKTIRPIVPALRHLPLMIIQINRLTVSVDALLAGDDEQLAKARKQWAESDKLSL